MPSRDLNTHPDGYAFPDPVKSTEPVFSDKYIQSFQRLLWTGL
jgi:hypothetical protein